jgi:16S rRNA (guanine527-N7)-methyltransferase
MADRERLERRLRTGVDALRLALDDAAIARLLDYIDLLVRWNAAYNLTAVRDPDEMVTRHLLDSLAVAPYVTGETLADLGSGAGLPGIPLAIVAPERRVTLVDSNGKKARFLREAVRKLGLARATVAESRVENVDGAFDCITARAFSSLGEMLAWGGHLLAPGGRWLALKGRFPDDELAAVSDDFEIERTIELNVPGLDANRHLIVLKRR